LSGCRNASYLTVEAIAKYCAVSLKVLTLIGTPLVAEDTEFLHDICPQLEYVFHNNNSILSPVEIEIQNWFRAPSVQQHIDQQVSVRVSLANVYQYVENDVDDDEENYDTTRCVYDYHNNESSITVRCRIFQYNCTCDADICQKYCYYYENNIKVPQLMFTLNISYDSTLRELHGKLCRIFCIPAEKLNFVSLLVFLFQ